MGEQLGDAYLVMERPIRDLGGWCSACQWGNVKTRLSLSFVPGVFRGFTWQSNDNLVGRQDGVVVGARSSRRLPGSLRRDPELLLNWLWGSLGAQQWSGGTMNLDPVVPLERPPNPVAPVRAHPSCARWMWNSLVVTAPHVTPVAPIASLPDRNKLGSFINVSDRIETAKHEHVGCQKHILQESCIRTRRSKDNDRGPGVGFGASSSSASGAAHPDSVTTNA